MHLIHPALVHFAVAFLLTGTLAEASGILFRRERVERFGGVLVLCGAAALVPTVAAGFLALNAIDLEPEAARAAADHERMGIVVLGIVLALLFWKGWNRGVVPAAARPWYAGSLLATAAAVGYASYLGGRLVYGHGAGVGLP